MKKVHRLLLIVSLLLCACSSDKNETDSTEKKSTSENSIVAKSETTTKKESTSLTIEEPEAPIYQGDYELPLAGATGYASVSLEVKKEPEATAEVLTPISPGTAYTILGEENGWLNIKLDDTVGWIQNQYSLVNLPDIIPSIIYKNTNVEASVFYSSGQTIPGITHQSLYKSKGFNERLKKEQFIMPVLFPMAKKLMAMQKMALSENNTLVLYEAFRPLSVQLQVAEAVKNLASENPLVLQGITQPPWSINWFISTQVSNHQVGYTIDVSLAKVTVFSEEKYGKHRVRTVSRYEEYAMHTNIHELSVRSAIFTAPVTVLSPTAWQQGVLTPEVNQFELLLQKYATSSGLTPLASEWWHFNDLDALNLLAGNTGNGDYVLTETKSTWIE